MVLVVVAFCDGGGAIVVSGCVVLVLMLPVLWRCY